MFISEWCRRALLWRLRCSASVYNKRHCFPACPFLWQSATFVIAPQKLTAACAETQHIDLGVDLAKVRSHTEAPGPVSRSRRGSAHKHSRSSKSSCRSRSRMGMVRAARHSQQRPHSTEVPAPHPATHLLQPEVTARLPSTLGKIDSADGHLRHGTVLIRAFASAYSAASGTGVPSMWLLT